ncbi:hypothetical protein RSOL_244090, partial [Rhizoctonia solani AG-3 Rhs1AP]
MGRYGTDRSDAAEEPMKQADPDRHNEEQATLVEKRTSATSGGHKGKQKETASGKGNIYPSPHPPSESNPEVEQIKASAVTRTATSAMLPAPTKLVSSTQTEVIQLEESEEEDLYAAFPPSEETELPPGDDMDLPQGEEMEIPAGEETEFTPVEETELTQDENTKHTSIPNPFMPPPSQQAHSTAQGCCLPFTVQAILAELPAVLEEPRRGSLSLNEAGRPMTVVTPDLGLGLTVDPLPDDIFTLGVPGDTSTPYPRGRALIPSTHQAAAKHLVSTHCGQVPTDQASGHVHFKVTGTYPFNASIIVRTRNNVPAPPGLTVDKDRRTSARNLAMKRYGQAIAELAREISQMKPNLNKMSTFNEATTQFLDAMKRDDLLAYEKLKADATEIRQVSHKDYTELSPENLTQLLGEFPEKFNNELANYARALPVHIWSVVSYADVYAHSPWNEYLRQSFDNGQQLQSMDARQSRYSGCPPNGDRRANGVSQYQESYASLFAGPGQCGHVASPTTSFIIANVL